MEPYEGTKPYIFISYVRRDWKLVAPFLVALSNAGYRFWYDAGIQAGEYWTETLVEKIEGCAAFCPLVSKAFNASDFCFEETNYAFSEKKTIVPVYLEAMEKKELRPLYRLLHIRQDLRLYQYGDAVQLTERLGREQAFAPCKVPEWHKIGQIQWRLGVDGILTIEANEDISQTWLRGSIPSYQYDPNGGSTAPWMPYREKILSVAIGDGVSTIGDYAIFACYNLMSVRISNGVTAIHDFAFCSCIHLTDIRISDSVTKIGERAFQFCHSLTNVYIPDSVTEIGNAAFGHCSSLTDVRIPDSVTKIGDYAFWACLHLENVEIPANVEVGKKAFPENTCVTRREVTR